MTEEQINKAAEEYSLRVNGHYYPIIPEDFNRSIGEVTENAFVEGANFANKHWQEKNRWIPVTERLPERISQNTTISRQVITKIENMGYRIKQYDLTLGWVPMYANEKVISWREIE